MPRRAGIVDLGRKSIKIVEPFLTIAGETATSPGVTLIKGGLAIETHDAVDRRIVEAVRAGTGRVIDDEQQVSGYPR